LKEDAQEDQSHAAHAPDHLLDLVADREAFGDQEVAVQEAHHHLAIQDHQAQEAFGDQEVVDPGELDLVQDHQAQEAFGDQEVVDPEELDLVQVQHPATKDPTTDREVYGDLAGEEEDHTALTLHRTLSTSDAQDTQFQALRSPRLAPFQLNVLLHQRSSLALTNRRTFMSLARAYMYQAP
jgi:hypothetical protein